MSKIRLFDISDDLVDFVIVDSSMKYPKGIDIKISPKKLSRYKRAFKEFAAVQAELKNLLDKGKVNAEGVQVSVMGGGTGEE